MQRTPWSERRLWAIPAICLLASTPAYGQQMADSTFVPGVEDPAYPTGAGPRVAVDSAHHNFHTSFDRYAPFAAILRADGYRVDDYARPFAASTLDGIDVLVIANAGTDEGSSWSLPTPSALAEDEIAAVVNWVGSGGSLFLIADHMPAAGAVSALAARFDVYLTNGYTIGRKRTANLPGDKFSRSDGTLYDHPITRGRTDSERVEEVVTFTGQGFQTSARVDTLLRFDPEAFSLLPVTAGEGFTPETPRVYSGGWLHAAALRSGNGRVVIAGEAAMFSAQRGAAGAPMGLNHPAARQNEQFLLNIMHWLTGLLD